MITQIISQTKNDLEKVIRSSSLTDDQKYLWTNLIDNLNENDLDLFLELLQNNDDTLNFLTKNIQDKLGALKTKDVSVWREIIADEKRYLSAYA